jgi:hypothetical protein
MGQNPACCTDEKKFNQSADTWVRKKVALILANGILKNIPLKTIAAAAKRQDIPLVAKKINGELVLVLPEDKKELKAVLQFLDEDDYNGPLTGTRYISNSKRRA